MQRGDLMGIYDWLFLGKTQELGVIRKGGLMRGFRMTAVMAERRGKLKFVIKYSNWGTIGHFDFSQGEASVIREALVRFEDELQGYEAKEREDG